MWSARNAIVKSNVNAIKLLGMTAAL